MTQVCLKFIYLDLDYVFMSTYLFGFCFCFTLSTANNASLFFSLISADCDYYNVVFVYVHGQKITLCFFVSFFPDLCSLPYHVLHCTAVETPSFPYIVCNSLMLYNNVSILSVLPGEFQQKFQILHFQASYVRAQLKKFRKMWTKAFDICGSSFFMYV